MIAHDIIEALGAVVMFFLSVIVGWVGFQLRSLRTDVNLMMISLAKCVTFDVLGEKIGSLHSKINEVDKYTTRDIAIVKNELERR